MSPSGQGLQPGDGDLDLQARVLAVYITNLMGALAALEPYGARCSRAAQVFGSGSAELVSVDAHNLSHDVDDAARAWRTCEPGIGSNQSCLHDFGESDVEGVPGAQRSSQLPDPLE